MKRLIVRYLYRFRVIRGENRSYWIAVKPVFGPWCVLAEEFFVLRKLANQRVEELRGKDWEVVWRMN